MLSRGNMVQGVWVIALSGLAFSAWAAGPARIKITSSAFQQGENIPEKFTCDGGNHSPSLQFHEIPSAARSLVLIVDDPDAPGGLFTHWLVWNIDPKTTTLGEGSTPGGVSGTNDFEKAGYGGPCPPSGTHRYFFRVFALDRQLDLPAGARRGQLDALMKGHVMAQGELMGRYSRRK